MTPSDVHIWWLRHSPPTSFHGMSSFQEACTALLTSEEAAECTSSQDVAAMELRLLARAFTRSVLCRYLAGTTTSHDPTMTATITNDFSKINTSEVIHPSALIFSRNQHGKPELCHPPTSLRFNLTHTPGLIGVAVTTGRAVGLDAESKARKTRGDALRLARRRFSQVEIDQLERIEDPEARAALFMKLWTLKEAYVKAVGKGISAPPGLRGFSFQLEEDARKVVFNSAHEVGKWEFALLQPVEGHLAALCCERGKKEEEVMKANGSTINDGSVRITSFMTDAATDSPAVCCSPEILALGNN